MRNAHSSVRGISAAWLLALAFLLPVSVPSAAAGLPGEAFQAILDQTAAAGTPAIVARVEAPDGETWTGAAGYATLGGESVTSESLFRLFSITKTIVAASAFTLIDEGKLGLDDPIGKWLAPELIANLPHAGEVTVRHLIAQTSGIRDYDDAWFDDRVREDMTRVWTPEELVVHAAEGDAVAPPGDGTSYYSNTNYVLLGLIIEKASGMTLADAIRTRVLEPLGASHTFSPGAPGRSELVTAYYSEGGELIDVSAFDPSAIWAAGDLASTAKDAAKLMRGILAGDLLSPETRALMTGDFRPLSGRQIEYGYGSFRAPQWTPAPIGHSGEGPGGDAIAMWWPDDGTVVVVMTNLENGAHVEAFRKIAALLGK